MKIQFANGKVVAVVTDGHSGPGDCYPVPEDYDESKAFDYVLVDGVVTLPSCLTPVVSRRALKQALTRTGLRASVEAAVALGDQDLKDWYAEALEFERSHESVIAMGVGLGVSEAQLDDLWNLAGTL